jgi:hypothetical protein
MKRIRRAGRQADQEKTLKSVSLEELDRPLMFLGVGQRGKRAKVSSLAGLGIDLSRVQAIFAAC